jgi:phasin family protein
MIDKLDEMQKLGKDGVEAALQSFAATSKGVQALLGEYAGYARKSFEQGSSAFEKLIEARSPERAFEVQSEFVKDAYEAFLAQTQRVGEMVADTAKQSYQPLEAYASRVKPAAL